MSEPPRDNGSQLQSPAVRLRKWRKGTVWLLGLAALALAVMKWTFHGQEVLHAVAVSLRGPGLVQVLLAASICVSVLVVAVLKVLERWW